MNTAAQFLKILIPIGGFIACVALLVASVPLVLAVRDARSVRFAERERTRGRVPLDPVERPA